MNQSSTKLTISEVKTVLLHLTQKFTYMFFRWGIYLFLGVLAWLLFDPLSPIFLWGTIVLMLGAMSLHTVLHQRDKSLTLGKQVCRFTFFFSFPMLFIFAGNRLASWSIAEDSAEITAFQGVPKAQGVIATEEYLIYKALKKEGFKDPVKTKKGIKQILKKHLKKAKKMDEATKIILIVLGALLLIGILALVALIAAFNDASNSCSGSSTDSGCL